jgi:aminoglycoside phosphotransferase (APT) family kinase protein
MPNIGEILAGQQGMAGVQQLLSGPRSRQTLRQTLRSMLTQPAQLGACRLRRAKFKPGRKLTAYYDLELLQATGKVVRPLAVTWTLPGAVQTLPTAELASSEATALAQGLAAPFQQLSATKPAWGMQVQVSPLDPRFSQLLCLVDPQYVHSLLATTATSHGGYTITAIRYRPGQRHVLRYDPIGAAPGAGSVFAKLYSDASGAHFYSKINQVADWVCANQPDLRILRPQAYLATERALLYPWAAGRPLSHLLHKRPNAQGQTLQQIGSALRTAHGLPAPLTQDLPKHELAAEVKAITRTCEHIQLFLPTVGQTIQRILEQAQVSYAHLPEEAPTFVHGDCKADHVLVAPQDTGTGLTFIDLDSCARGDPASDIGKFLADLVWWYAQSNQSGLADAQEAFLAGYGMAGLGSRLQRARVWEALILLKMTAHRVPLFKRDWAQQTTALVQQVESLAFS